MKLENILPKNTTFKSNKDGVNKLVNEYMCNLSLHFTDKASLPLEEFANFYFKELSYLSVKDRIYRAYNDALSVAVNKLFTPTYEGYSSFEQLWDNNSSMFNSYLQKAMFAKIYARKYIASKKSALELIEDKSFEEKFWKKEVRKYLAIFSSSD